MAQNEPQRKETPPGPSPNSPSLLFEYQCRSSKVIRLASRIGSKKSIRQRESNRIETFSPELECSSLFHSSRVAESRSGCAAERPAERTYQSTAAATSSNGAIARRSTANIMLTAQLARLNMNLYRHNKPQLPAMRPHIQVYARR